MTKRVVVVGGGLAGMAAAVALQSAGQNVTLLEARKTLGGRAGSYEDPQTGEILDNCQHVRFSVAVPNLIDFYRAHQRSRPHSLGKYDSFRRLHADNIACGLSKVFPPFHLAMAGLSFGALTLSERIVRSPAQCSRCCALAPPVARKLADTFLRRLARKAQSTPIA